MERDVIKAMPRARAIWLVCLGIIAGAAVVGSKGFLFAYLANYLSVADRDEALFRFRVVMAGLGLTLVPPTVYCGVLAYRVTALRQFPLPGTQVWRNTPVVRGRLPLARAALFALLAAVMACAAIYLQFIPILSVPHA